MLLKAVLTLLGLAEFVKAESQEAAEEAIKRFAVIFVLFHVPNNLIHTNAVWRTGRPWYQLVLLYIKH